MSQTITLKEKCPQCHGTGLYEPSSGEGSSPLPCNWPDCSEGYVNKGQVIIDPGLDDILDKCKDILELLQE
jgi:hypothetical protein